MYTSGARSHFTGLRTSGVSEPPYYKNQSRFSKWYKLAKHANEAPVRAYLVLLSLSQYLDGEVVRTCFRTTTRYAGSLAHRWILRVRRPTEQPNSSDTIDCIRCREVVWFSSSLFSLTYTFLFLPLFPRLLICSGVRLSRKVSLTILPSMVRPCAFFYGISALAGAIAMAETVPEGVMKLDVRHRHVPYASVRSSHRKRDSTVAATLALNDQWASTGLCFIDVEVGTPTTEV